MVDDGTPLGWVEPSAVREDGSGTVEFGHLNRSGIVASITSSPREVLDAALSSPTGRGVIVDGEGRFLGTVRASDLVALLEAERDSS